jgi:hypothetical protein
MTIILTGDVSPLTLQQYQDLLVSLISGGEGHEPAATRPPNDPKVTIGYGYTFTRNDNLQLWHAGGISLTAAEYATAGHRCRAARAAQYARSAIHQSDLESRSDRTAASNVSSARMISQHLFVSRPGAQTHKALPAIAAEPAQEG